MSKIIKFKRKKTLTQDILVMLSLAVIVGLIISVFLPDDIFVFDTTNAPPAIESDITGYAIVTDGDTIKINNTRIRLDAIDAPEIDQTCTRNGARYNCGQTSKSHLIKLIGNSDVSCIVNGQDQYDRQLAACYNNKNEDLNAEMVTAGHAIAYLFYSTKYEDQQDEARKSKNGIWSGEFIEPYQFRRNKR